VIDRHSDDTITITITVTVAVAVTVTIAVTIAITITITVWRIGDMTPASRSEGNCDDQHEKLYKP
jgi:hypothetical protein